MLRKVRDVWIKGVLEQSLYNVARLELGLVTKPDAVQDVWELVLQRADQPERHLPRGTRISAAFDEFGKALLILGAPGAGKTTLLLELTKDLLDRAETDSDPAIPVVFNLSSWAGRQPPLNNWLIDELSERYQVPRKHAESWIAKDLILPLLDGLDEVAAKSRSACAEAINAFRKGHGLVPLAICSRVADYETLTIKLNVPGALVVQPLTREQTVYYLTEAGASLAGLRAQLSTDEALWELLDTPLTLSVAALAYQGRSAAKVQTSGSLEERRTQLFAAYTDAMFKRRGKTFLYSREQTIRWLAWLASAMVRHAQSEFYVEWVQPNWLSSKWQQSMMNVGVVIFCGLVCGLFGMLCGGLVIGLLFWRLDYALEVGLTTALIGMGSGLLMGFGNVLWTGKLGIRPVETVQWVWFKAKKCWFSRLVVGAKFGSLFGVALTVIGLLLFLLLNLPEVIKISEQSHSNMKWLNGILGSGLIGGSLGGLLGGLVNVLSGALVLSNIEIREIPNEGIRRSFRNAFLLGSSIIFLMLSMALLIWFLTYLNLEQHEIFGNAIIFGLVPMMLCGPFVAAFVGLQNGGIACIQHLTLRLLLWHNGFAPWRYVCFLDYVTERVFLRKVGGGYIFIHRMLLEYFATLYRSNTAKK